MDVQEMRVQKRCGNFEDVSFDKILRRVKNLGSKTNPPIRINYSDGYETPDDVLCEL